MTVIVINFFGHRDVSRALDSLVANDAPDWRMFVVDNSCNAAEFEQVQQVCSRDQRAEVALAPANLGYFGGARWAVETIKDLYIPSARGWLVVANADLVFDTDFIRILRDHEARGVLAPSVCSQRSGRDQNPYLRSRPPRWRIRVWKAQFRWVWIARIIGLASELRHFLNWRAAGSRPSGGPIYAPHGSCLVLAPDYVFDPGASSVVAAGLHHPAFLFGEEIFVAERCRRLGMRPIYRPQLRASHAEHQATGWWRSRELLERQRESIATIAELLNSRSAGMP